MTPDTPVCHLQSHVRSKVVLPREKRKVQVLALPMFGRREAMVRPVRRQGSTAGAANACSELIRSAANDSSV